MARIQSLGVYGKGVKDGIRVLSLFGDEVCLGPGHGTQGQFPPPLRRKAFVLRIVELQFQTALGIPGKPFRSRKVPEGIRLKHLHRLDGGPYKCLQPLPLQAVGREGSVLSIGKKLKLQAPVQGMGRLVPLSVQQANEVHQAFGKGDADFLGPASEGVIKAVLRQRNLLFCQKGFLHAILLLRLNGR